MRTIDDLTGWAARQWRANWPGWLADPGQAAPSWPLHTPTAREIAADPDGVAREVGRWVAVGARGGLTVEWVLDTHPHADHDMASAHLKGRTGAPAAIGDKVHDIARIWAGLYNLPGAFDPARQ